MTGPALRRPATHEQPPSVLFLLSSLATGGSELKTVRLANALTSRGVPVLLACLGPPFSLRPEIAPRVPFLDLQRRGKLSLRSLRLLVRAIHEQSVGTIVAINPYPALYAQLARLAVGDPKPRIIATVNTTDVASRKLALQMHLYRRILRAADLVIFGAEAQRRLWSRLYGVGTDRARVIYNGVDTERFAPGAASDRTRDSASSRRVIGTVGQMRPEKSQVDLVRATALLRARGFDVHALIVGEGAERPRIEAEIARLGLGSHVTLAGERRDVRPALAAMDVFVLTSTAVETFSNAALEALSCGIPVVSSDIGGIRELLAYGGGVTYPPGDVPSLCEHLARILGDGERRMSLAAEARRAAQEHFSWSSMVQEFANMLAPAGMSLAEPPRWRPQISGRTSAS